jgi:hypothetical protein
VFNGVGDGTTSCCGSDGSGAEAGGEEGSGMAASLATCGEEGCGVENGDNAENGDDLGSAFNTDGGCTVAVVLCILGIEVEGSSPEEGCPTLGDVGSEGRLGSGREGLLEELAGGKPSKFALGGGFDGIAAAPGPSPT